MGQVNRGIYEVADTVKIKIDTIFSKKYGYKELWKIVATMYGNSRMKITLDLTPIYHNPIISCDVESNFSQYMLTDFR